MGTTKKGVQTTKLMRMLNTSPNQFLKNQVMEQKEKVRFQDYLYGLLEEQGMTTTELISASLISKTYCYQLLNGERLPGRDIAIRIALGMHLSVNETQRLLTIAEKGVLYPKQKRDAAILYCIREKRSLSETDEMLSEIGELPLIVE